MLKKWMFALLASMVLTVPVFADSSYADPAMIQLNDGKLENNRLMIPLRVVSEQLGAKVNWDQQSKTVTIFKDHTTVKLTLNSTQVQVNQLTVTLDVPAKLYNGSRTYVPLRFVSQAMGAEVSWNQQALQATIQTTEKKIVIGMEQGKVEVPSSKRITEQRAKVIVEKLNEATNISSIKQIRSYFSPYFTDKFIHTIIQNKGLAYDSKFTRIWPSAISYKDQNTATLIQSTEPDSKYGTSQTLYRKVTLVFTSKGWKVDGVSFELVDEILNP